MWRVLGSVSRVVPRYGVEHLHPVIREAAKDMELDELAINVRFSFLFILKSQCCFVVLPCRLNIARLAFKRFEVLGSWAVLRLW